MITHDNICVFWKVEVMTSFFLRNEAVNLLFEALPQRSSLSPLPAPSEQETETVQPYSLVGDRSRWEREMN